METSTTAGKSPLPQRVTAFLRLPKLPLWLGLVAVALASPSLFIGFHLDDYVHRYLLLRLPGADLLARSYVSPFAIANGDPALNHWLIEQGYAPWWTYDRLLLSFFRPLSAMTHHVDYALWPDSPLLMHAHSLLWFGAVVVAAAFVYRGVLGATLPAGLAAFFYAVDHSHGFPVGWVANRNALPPVLFGTLALYAHDQGRRHGSSVARVLAPACFVVGLLGGEITMGAFAYVLAYAVTLDPGTPKERAASVAPYVVITVVWRAVYNHLGYGARGSGLYLDPVHEPLAFLQSVFVRVPLLLLGELGLPPAESYYFVPPALRVAIVVAAVLLVVALVVALVPLARKDPTSRFWALGMALSLPLACTAYPHNRLLFFVSLGAMGLLAQLLHDALVHAAWLPLNPLWHLVAQPFLAVSVGVHAFLSPVLLPVAACAVATTHSITERAVPSALAGMKSPDEELVVVSAPEYFSVNLIPVMQALDGKPGPARLRMLSVGPVPLAVRRMSPNQLEIDYEGGLLAAPLTELYRSARIPMSVGERIELHGLTIELTRVTADGRPATAVFAFEEPLESPRYRFIQWGKDAYVPFRPPAVGAVERVRAARMPFELGSGSDGS